MAGAATPRHVPHDRARQRVLHSRSTAATNRSSPFIGAFGDDDVGHFRPPLVTMPALSSTTESMPATDSSAVAFFNSIPRRRVNPGCAEERNKDETERGH